MFNNKMELFTIAIFCVGMARCFEGISYKDDVISTLMEEVKFLRQDLTNLKNECLLKSDIKDYSKRLLLPDNPPTNVVAFSAYLTHLNTGPAIGKLREIVYDKIETNIGNGYDPFSGTFRAPIDGVYAFTWTIFVAGNPSLHGEITTELIINGQIHGNVHADTEHDNDDDTGTGFIIKSIRKDDIIFIRSSNAFVPQGVLMDGHMRWTFSGWLIE